MFDFIPIALFNATKLYVPIVMLNLVYFVQFASSGQHHVSFFCIFILLPLQTTFYTTDQKTFYLLITR